MTASAGMSQYQRLGGYNAISAVVTELYCRMVKDSHVWYYWKGLSADIIAIESQRFTDLVCAAAGKNGTLQSRDGKIPYTSLGISNVEWEYFVYLAAETLEQSELTDKERDGLFSMLAKSKAAITVDSQARTATALLDRLTHHAHILTTRGESYRSLRMRRRTEAAAATGSK